MDYRTKILLLSFTIIIDSLRFLFLLLRHVYAHLHHYLLLLLHLIHYLHLHLHLHFNLLLDLDLDLDLDNKLPNITVMLPNNQTIQSISAGFITLPHIVTPLRVFILRDVDLRCSLFGLAASLPCCLVRPRLSRCIH